jgi:WD40 repeat protein
MKLFKETASSSLRLPKDSYIYNFAEVTIDRSDNTCSLAVISSDDSLRIFDVNSLDLVPDGVFESVHSSVTAIARFASSAYFPLLLTSGRDGFVRGWDTRSGSKAVELAAPNGEPLSALACDAGLQAVIAGTELERDGPGDVNVYGWDLRVQDKVMLNYAQSHTDTITELGFLPTNGKNAGIIFSGSTDGLINVYNSSESDEDEAVLQVINHKSAIHHAGLVGDDIYALGTDETLSFYRQQISDVELEVPQPVHLGDVRERLDCNYIIGIVQTYPEASILAAGNYSEHPRVDLAPLVKNGPALSLEWTPDLNEQIRLAGGHGQEVVRDVVVLPIQSVAFTCGEDGMVRVWKESSSNAHELGGGDNSNVYGKI